MASVAKNKSDLKKRLLRFFDSRDPGRNAVRTFVDGIAEKGDVFVFGGLIRDIALEGVASFESDIDCVYDGDIEEIRGLLDERKAGTNKFGGFRFMVKNWQIDLWETKKTWAVAKGWVQYRGVESLLETTMTNWDSVLFDWKRKTVICRDGYFGDLNSKYIDIVFDKSPNELGMYVRLLRYYASKDAYKISSKMALMVRYAVENYSYDQIRSIESRSFEKCYITHSLVSYLKEHQNVKQPGLLPIELDRVNTTKDLI